MFIIRDEFLEPYIYIWFPSNILIIIYELIYINIDEINLKVDEID